MYIDIIKKQINNGLVDLYLFVENINHKIIIDEVMDFYGYSEAKPIITFKDNLIIHGIKFHDGYNSNKKGLIVNYKIEKI